MNRAYEVLKDEDLRKKYDKYGEKGFDDHKQGGQYESWNYYRYDFGECPFTCIFEMVFLCDIAIVKCCLTFFFFLICF